jgi:hypothetical protein
MILSIAFALVFIAGCVVGGWALAWFIENVIFGSHRGYG